MRKVSINASWGDTWSEHNRVQMLTLTAVPAKATRHIRGFDGPFLAGLQKNKQPLQLVRDTGNGILLRLFKLPADRLTDVITELENV